MDYTLPAPRPQIASSTGMHGPLIYLYVYNISRCYPVQVDTGIPFLFGTHVPQLNIPVLYALIICFNAWAVQEHTVYTHSLV